jgi:hypothetical protein
MNQLESASCEQETRFEEASCAGLPDAPSAPEERSEQMLVGYMNNLHMLKIYTVCNGLWDKVRAMRSLHRDHPLWKEQHELYDALVADRVRQVRNHIEAWQGNIYDVGTQYRALLSIDTFQRHFPDHEEGTHLRRAYEQVSHARGL